MAIHRLLIHLFEFFDPMFYMLVGIGIGYIAALAVMEYCNRGRMSENDLLRWENAQLRSSIETHLQSPDCNAAAAPKPFAALLVEVRTTGNHKEK